MEVQLHSAHRGRGQEPVRGQRQRQRGAKLLCEVFAFENMTLYLQY